MSRVNEIKGGRVVRTRYWTIRVAVGRFANRTSGTRPWKPSEEGASGSGSNKKSEKLQANATTPRPPAEGSSAKSERGYRKNGRKLSLTKRDQLRADGVF